MSGGKGFVGSAIVSEARQRGYRTVVVDKEEYASAIGTSCDLLINANGNSRKYLAAKDPGQEFDLSVRSVLRSLHDFKAGHYVYLSTIDVYPNHEDPEKNTEDTPIDEKALSPYGFHKHLSEKIVRYYASRWTIVRMGGFVGPGLWKNSIYDLLTGANLKAHPDSVYQYLHTADLARRLFDLVASTPSQEIWNISGAGLVSLRDVASWIPNAKLPAEDSLLSREHYEINTRKIEARVPLPRSVDTVKKFVQDVQSGRERIQ
jgi:nucleoside-diphosphate-sugar epimerase